MFSTRRSAPLRVLVLDENDASRSHMHELLTHAGYRTMTSDHLLDPVDIQQLRPDVILLELDFRNACVGWDYLRLLRACPGTRQFPVVLCTANADSIRTATGVQLDLAHGLVLKPFEDDEMLETIAGILCPSSPVAHLLVSGELSGRHAGLDA